MAISEISQRTPLWKKFVIVTAMRVKIEKGKYYRYQISVLSIVPPTRRQKFTAKRWPS